MSANPFPAANHGPHTLKKHVLRIRNLERRPGGAGSRRVYGQIDSGSTTPHDEGSSDWTVDTDFAGTWTITIDPPFQVLPTVVCSENETTTDPPSFIQVTSVALDTIVVQTFDKTGTLDDDRGFNFQALGI
jgi:hypothetical protein